MKVENGKIIEITEDELYSRYLANDDCMIYDFPTYCFLMEKAGTKIIKETPSKQEILNKLGSEPNWEKEPTRKYRMTGIYVKKGKKKRERRG